VNRVGNPVCFVQAKLTVIYPFTNSRPNKASFSRLQGKRIVFLFEKDYFGTLRANLFMSLFHS